MAAGSPGDDGPRYLFDKEGWRLNLFGERPSDDQLERDRQRQFERELQAAQERWEGGDLTAFAEALRRCHWYQRAPPRWLVEASEALVEAATAEHEKRARREWRMHAFDAMGSGDGAARAAARVEQTDACPQRARRDNLAAQ
jgi:hypothetical protein